MDAVEINENHTEQILKDTDIKILLVDDREDNLFSIETILQQDGYLFTKARSGKEALKILLKEQDFSLILMDVQMPGLNGFDTASLIYEREKLRQIPIIFITAFDYGDENIYRGYKMGAVDYIYKPINKDLLRAKISVFIELYKKNFQLRAQEQFLISVNNELEMRVKERTEELVNKNIELELKNKELERINSDLDNFIYTASHDLKAPIANLEALIFLLTKKMSSKFDDDEKKLFDMFGLSLNRLNDTIKDLTEIARVQKDSDEQIEKVAFKEMFDNIRIDTNKLFAESEATINEIYDIPEIYFPRKNLRSICYNLFTNALKYRDPRRPLQVTIQTYRRNEYAVLSVADNGLGIGDEHKAKMFTMFRRFHSHVEGSGIGLYIVKKIVENNGGKIELESEKGKGTTFKVYFKMQNEKTSEESAATI